MDPYSSPFIIPNKGPHHPFPPIVLRALGFRGLGVRVSGFKGLGFCSGVSLGLPVSAWDLLTLD